MRLFLPLVIVLALCTSTAVSQSKVTAGPGVELSVPTGDFADVAGIGFGVSGRVQYAYQWNLGFVGTLGYVWWTEKDVGSLKSSTNALSILIGPKIYFQQNFYGLPEIGIYSASATVKGTTPTGTPYEIKDTESNFMLALGVGYEYKAFEFEVKYFVVDPDVTNLGLRVGYRFDL